MNAPLNLSRRGLLATAAGFGLSLQLLAVPAVAADSALNRKKVIVVICRGGMDGLSVAPPVGDSDYRSLRGGLALNENALPLDGTFALHPQLTAVHALAKAGEARIVPAIATPDRARSHFEAQDVLETGAPGVYSTTSGWLNRTVETLSAHRRIDALSVGPTAPLILRGKVQTASWSPGRSVDAEARLPTLLQDLYRNDPLLGPTLARGLATEIMAKDATAGLSGGVSPAMAGGGKGGGAAPGIPGGGNEAPEDDDQPEQGYIGSGFLLSAEGYVMTNAHVVEGADEVTVTLTDKREFKARIIGSDQRTDVALLKIEAAGLPFVRIGNVDRLKVGEWVIAIGSPFGLESTVTAGIVSAKQRETGDYLQLLQTDVAINPGNSGGPLINMRGEVVGINSQILSPSGTSAGISLAIPIDEAIRVSDQLRASGHVTRGRIGVQIGPVSRQVAETLGLGKPVGALVEGLTAGMPAEKAGIEAGDIITKVQGKSVERFSDLPRLVGMVKPGDKVTLQVFHDGKYKDVTANVIDFGPETPPVLANATPDPVASTKATLGLKVGDLSDDDRTRLHVKNGVRVEGVEGAAARAGVHEGDVILSIGNVPVTSAKQFAAAVVKLDRTKSIAVLVRRGDSANYLVIRPTK